MVSLFWCNEKDKNCEKKKNRTNLFFFVSLVCVVVTSERDIIQNTKNDETNADDDEKQRFEFVDKEHE